MRNDAGSKPIVAWGGIIAATVFFFNPNIGIIDILPDFIGYLLLCGAISKIAAIDDRMGDAHTLFMRAMYITLVRFMSLFAVFGFIPPSDQSMSMLLFAFVFDVLELLTVIPAIIKISEGIIYLSTRHNGEAAFLPSGIRAKKRNDDYRKSITDKVRNTAVFFAFYKAFCGTVPEFASLSGQGWDESVWGSIYQYVGLFRIFGVLLSVIGGIVFLTRTLRYTAKLRRDKEMLEALSGVYESEVLARKDLLAKRAVTTSFGYFGIASVLMLDFSVDNFNIVPDVLSALCLLAGLLIIRKYITSWKKTAIAASIFGIVSIAATIAEYIFASKYYIEAVAIDPATWNAYTLICVLSAVSSISYIAAVVLLARKTMVEIIEKHTGFAMTTNDTYDPSQRILQLHNELSHKMTLLIILAVLTAVMKIASKLLINTVGFFWIFGFVITIIYAVVTFKTLSDIKTQIDYKYMLT